MSHRPAVVRSRHHSHGDFSDLRAVDSGPGKRGLTGEGDLRVTGAPVTGYLHSGYAESLAEFGTPRELPQCGGWILERIIPASRDVDAMGCYPLFACRDWGNLHQDLEPLEDQLVSLTLVTDPFGEYDETALERCFRDVVMPFQEHFVIDLSRPSHEGVSRHHRAYARKALAKIRVELCRQPQHFLNEWMDLHRTLIARHAISGVRAFSRPAFAAQLALPGTVVLRACCGNTLVGAQIWLLHGNVAYGHVLAFNDAGYELGASYALYWCAIEHFSQTVRWCDIGAVPNMTGSGAEGLRRFKRGWSRSTRTAYLCGRIFDRGRYAELAAARGGSTIDYFPAYRVGEFAPARRPALAQAGEKPQPWKPS